MLTTGQDTQQMINSAQAQDRFNKNWESAQAQRQMDFQNTSNAKAMAFSAQQAQIARDFEERMSNTAHQREIKDLVSAGLNPILSATRGASTPSSPSASGVSSSGSKGNTDSSMTNMFSGMLQAIIGQATALQTTAMNNQTSLETTKMTNDISKIISQIGASAQLGSANINASTNDKINQRNVNWEREAKQKYPSTFVGVASSLMQKLLDAVNTANTTGGKAYAEKIQKWQNSKAKKNGSW